MTPDVPDATKTSRITKRKRKNKDKIKTSCKSQRRDDGIAFNDLPNEILAYILMKLSTNDLDRISQVSPRLHEIVHGLHRTIFNTSFGWLRGPLEKAIQHEGQDEDNAKTDFDWVEAYRIVQKAAETHLTAIKRRLYEKYLNPEGLAANLYKHRTEDELKDLLLKRRISLFSKMSKEERRENLLRYANIGNPSDNVEIRKEIERDMSNNSDTKGLMTPSSETTITSTLPTLFSEDVQLMMSSRYPRIWSNPTVYVVGIKDPSASQFSKLSPNYIHYEEIRSLPNKVKDGDIILLLPGYHHLPNFEKNVELIGLGKFGSVNIVCLLRHTFSTVFIRFANLLLHDVYFLINPFTKLQFDNCSIYKQKCEVHPLFRIGSHSSVQLDGCQIYLKDAPLFS